MDIRFDNDISLDGGDLAMVIGADEIGQHIKDRLLTFQGEWFLDLDFGPPYREQILVKNPDLEVVGAILRREILKTQAGEFTVFSVEFNNASRHLTMAASLVTTEGTVGVTITV